MSVTVGSNSLWNDGRSFPCCSGEQQFGSEREEACHEPLPAQRCLEVMVRQIVPDCNSASMLCRFMMCCWPVGTCMACNVPGGRRFGIPTSAVGLSVMRFRILGPVFWETAGFLAYSWIGDSYMTAGRAAVCAD
jgi:hypothetical protein